jgi:hypothetical protein
MREDAPRFKFEYGALVKGGNLDEERKPYGQKDRKVVGRVKADGATYPFDLTCIGFGVGSVGLHSRI